eukprot:360121-Chlamydomonas_euryale.AAC.9
MRRGSPRRAATTRRGVWVDWSLTADRASGAPCRSSQLAAPGAVLRAGSIDPPPSKSLHGRHADHDAAAVVRMSVVCEVSSHPSTPVGTFHKGWDQSLESSPKRDGVQSVIGPNLWHRSSTRRS